MKIGTNKLIWKSIYAMCTLNVSIKKHYDVTITPLFFLTLTLENWDNINYTLRQTYIHTHTYIYTHTHIVIFICKPPKGWKLWNLIMDVDENNQGTIWIHRKYENIKYMESQWLYGKFTLVGQEECCSSPIMVFYVKMGLQKKLSFHTSSWFSHY